MQEKKAPRATDGFGRAKRGLDGGFRGRGVVESRGFVPSLHSFSEKGKPMRLKQRSVAKDDPDPKAISCYGLFLPELDQTWLRGSWMVAP
jgi:hypothetical protein